MRFLDFTPEQQREIGAAYLKTVERDFEESRKGSWELVTFLFAAHSAAAAGLFIVLRSDPGNRWLIAAFFCFILGVASVGAAHFLNAHHLASYSLHNRECVRRVFANQLDIENLESEQN